MVKIKKVRAREILDSRSNPTVESEIILGDGSVIREQVPSGMSRGKYEVVELRDHGKKYHGKGVLRAVKNINNIISKKIIGYDLEDVSDIINIDNLMIRLDGTKNKGRLGGNAILAVSLAVSRAISHIHNEPLYKTLHKLTKNIAKYNSYKFNNLIKLPIPFMNIINGGKHADNGLTFQEFMIVPHTKKFKERLRIGSEVYYELKSIIAKRYGKGAVGVGDEGGFAPVFRDYREPIKLILNASDNLNYCKKIRIAIDVAASSFYNSKQKKYFINNKGIKSVTKDRMIKIYEDLVENYPIISIEDPLDEEDFEGFSKVSSKLPDVQIVGDDLLATNISRIYKAIRFNSCNALLLKPNQIGTISEAILAALVAFNNSWNVMVSHRSGETESSFISHLAVALGCGQIKAGAPARGERTAKYNELVRIEEEIG